MVYLDNAATTYPKPESVYRTMDDANRNLAFNGGRGSYKAAKEVTCLVDETKKMLLKLVNAPAGANVAFTPSITIALNEIILGANLQSGDNIYISPYEHNAVARVCQILREKCGVNVILLPLCEDTLEIDIEKMKYCFTQKHPSLVCCVHVSNVTGYILPIQAIFKAAKEYDAITVLDTAQSLGLVKVDSDQLQADFIAFAGHKALCGPLGVGGFISTSEKLLLNVVLAGGTGSNSLNLSMPKKAPERYEFASANIISIAGLNAALKELNETDNFVHEKKLIDYLTDKLKKIKQITVYSPKSEHHISVVSFNLSGYTAEDVGMILDQDYDIAVRTGYHCAPYIHDYLKDGSYVGTVRVSVGRFSAQEDLDCLINALEELCEG